MCQRSTADGTRARQMCCSRFSCLVYWRTICNGSFVHKACCSSWCDVAWSICIPSGRALDQMWCWSDPGCLAQNQQSKAWVNLILPKTLWPHGLRRWLKAPFRKGVGSDPTGVILFGLILCHGVLHTWSGPYVQRAPATLGPCRCLTIFFALHRPRPAYERQLQQGGNQTVRSPRAAILASARLAQQLGLRFVESLAGGRARS
jgi:hypothetical protein